MAEALLRPATVADAPALAVMAARIFHETFAHENDAGRMEAYMAEAFRPERLAAEIADPRNEYLLALTEDTIVGYIKIAWKSDAVPECVTGPLPIVELERFYVATSHHGTGIAGRLMQASLDRMTARGGKTVWLGVFETNTKARRFYAKWGFTEVGEHTFYLDDEAQTDQVMVRVL